MALAVLVPAALIAGALPIAAKVGPIVTERAALMGAMLSAGLLGGFAAGQAKRRGASSGTPIAITAVLILGAGAWIVSRDQKILAVAKELGLDKRPEKYVPEKNQACPENLKSLYTAFALYAQDWDALPPAAGWMDNPDLISKVQRNEWLHCPEISNRNDEKYGYAYNEAVAGRKLNGRPLKELPDAATTPLLYDSTDLARSAHDAFASRPQPGRHGGRNNILYCDGRVAAE